MALVGIQGFARILPVTIQDVFGQEGCSKMLISCAVGEMLVFGKVHLIRKDKLDFQINLILLTA